MIDRTIHWIKTAVIKENDLYCVYWKKPMLIKINLNNWIYEKIAVLEWDKHDLVTDVYEVDGQIICISLKGIKIAIFDPETKKIKYYKTESEMPELIDTLEYDHKIWFVPRNLPGKLFYYSLEHEEILEDYMWEKGIKQIGLYGRIAKKCFIEDGQIYIVHSGKIIKYDLKSHLMIEVKTPINGRFVDIARKDDMYYCIIENERRKIFSWNINNKQVWCNGETDKREYVKLTKVGNVIILDRADDIDLLIDAAITKWEISSNDHIAGANFINAIKYFDKWILLPWGNKCFLECSSDFTDIQKYEINISMRDILQNEKNVSEQEISLNDYAVNVLQIDTLSDRVSTTNGWKIYEILK